MFRRVLGRGVPTETRRLLTNNSTALIARDQPLASNTHVIRCIVIQSRPSLLFPALRCYATTTKKASTKTTTPKKTTKTTAKKATTTKTPAKPKAAPKKAIGRPKKLATKKAAAKKPAAKKPAAKKKAAKKATRKPAKPQTELQKKRTAANNYRRAAMLDSPKMLPVTGYIQFTVENGLTKGSNDVAASAKTNAVAWRNMSESEKERYNSIASQNKLANAQTYRKWVESHTPWEIRIANNARRHLNRLSREPRPPGARAKIVGHAIRLIRDERKIQRQDTPYIAYSRERWGSGDFKNVNPMDGSRSISREWNALSKEVKQKYHDVYLEGRPAYAMEYERVYGRKPAQTAAEKKLLKTSARETEPSEAV